MAFNINDCVHFRTSAAGEAYLLAWAAKTRDTVRAHVRMPGGQGDIIGDTAYIPRRKDGIWDMQFWDFCSVFSEAPEAERLSLIDGPLTAIKEYPENDLKTETFSLADSLIVSVTPHGEGCWLDHVRKNGPSIQDRVCPAGVAEDRHAIRLSGWDFVAVFGPNFFCGARQVVAGNRIDVSSPAPSLAREEPEEPDADVPTP